MIERRAYMQEDEQEQRGRNEAVQGACREIEEIRGVALSPGTLDVLMEAVWVRLAGRRETPGRPLQYATTPGFLAHFNLTSRRDLPGLADLKAAGLLDREPPRELAFPLGGREE